MAGSAVASSSSDPTTGKVVVGVAGSSRNDSDSSQKVGGENTHGLEGARICATLSQITLVLEQKGPGW
jgi:hypothetical protein